MCNGCLQRVLILVLKLHGPVLHANNAEIKFNEGFPELCLSEDKQQPPIQLMSPLLVCFILLEVLYVIFHLN